MSTEVLNGSQQPHKKRGANVGFINVFEGSTGRYRSSLGWLKWETSHGGERMATLLSLETVRTAQSGNLGKSLRLSIAICSGRARLEERGNDLTTLFARTDPNPALGIPSATSQHRNPPSLGSPPIPLRAFNHNFEHRPGR